MELQIKTPAIIGWSSKFQPIELFDVITLKKLDERKIQLKKACPECSRGESGYKIPTNDLNPVFKVTAELQNRRPTKFGVSIEIEKNIPTTSGLHSKFSNAAGVLVALNKLWKFDLNEKELFEIAKKVDPRLGKILFPAPTCQAVRSHTCLSGRQTQYTEHVLLIRPKHVQIDPQWASGKDVFKYFPDLKVIEKEIAKLGAINHGLTGNGPTLFGFFKEKPDIEAIQKKLKDKIDFIWTGKTCNVALKLLN